MASITTFAEASTIQQLSSHDYAAHFRDDWCIGSGRDGFPEIFESLLTCSVPHGGYVTACFLKVARTHFDKTLSSQNQPHTIALHLDFLRRTQTGAALFTVRDVKLGRQTSVIHITLTQGEREEVVGSITNSNLYTESGVSFPTGYTLSPAAPPVNLALLAQGKDPNWALQERMPFASFRKASTKTAFHFPRQGQVRRGIADEWIRMSNGEKWTNESLGYVSDTWQMPVEVLANEYNPYGFNTTKKSKNKTAAFWYPTVLLNLDVKKALPEDGVEWLFVRVQAKQVRNGRMDLEIVIMDEGGDIVALSHHIAYAVGAERNLAVRRKTDAKL